MRIVPSALLGAGILVLSACAAGAPEAGPDFVLFFTAQSTALDSAATNIVDTAAAAALAARSGPVIVAGYADRAGTPQANQILSRLRAQAVAERLVERGVDRARVHVRPRGAAGGDPGVESRRVEIFVGG
jgi:outer membrane protein OmpA-like peptidoglycan-associated protein